MIGSWVRRGSRVLGLVFKGGNKIHGEEVLYSGVRGGPGEKD